MAKTFLGPTNRPGIYFDAEDEHTPIIFIGQQEIEDRSAVLFWMQEDGFNFPVLINLTEGEDGIWRL